MPKSPKEMGDAIAKNLPAKTGRTFEEWVALTREKGLSSRKERIAWLKSEHGLGSVTAMFIAADAEGKSMVATYADEDALLEGMYGGDKAALRPIYDQLAKTAGKLGRDVELTVCKTYVGIRRKRQFAIIKPGARERVYLGLTLPGAKTGGRLLNAGSIGNDRMTHRIEIASKKDIDAEVIGWLKAAFDATA
jgi:predicted transport protein